MEPYRAKGEVMPHEDTAKAALLWRHATQKMALPALLDDARGEGDTREKMFAPPRKVPLEL